MIINKFNYEIYALDFLEGNLDEPTTRAMHQFLKAHPSIARELELLKPIPTVVATESIIYPKKRTLLKGKVAIVPIGSQNFKRVLAVAAAIALLCTTYFLGFKMGQGGVETRIVEKIIEVPVVLTPSDTSTTIAQTILAEVESTPQKLVQPSTILPTQTPSVVQNESELAARTTPPAFVEKQSVESSILDRSSAQPQQTAVAALQPKSITPLKKDYTTIVLFNANQQASDRFAISLPQRGFSRLKKLKAYVDKLPIGEIDTEVFVPTHFAEGE